MEASAKAAEMEVYAKAEAKRLERNRKARERYANKKAAEAYARIQAEVAAEEARKAAVLAEEKKEEEEEEEEEEEYTGDNDYCPICNVLTNTKNCCMSRSCCKCLEITFCDECGKDCEDMDCSHDWETHWICCKCSE